MNNSKSSISDAVFGGKWTDDYRSLGESIDFTAHCNSIDYHITEKFNKKIYQYIVPGMKQEHIKITKEWNNKERLLSLNVAGEYKDSITGYSAKINVDIAIDYKIYNKITHEIAEGILTIVLHEIIIKEPVVDFYQDFFGSELKSAQLSE